MAEGDTRRIFEALDTLRQQNARLEVLLSEKEKIYNIKFGQIEKLEERVSLLEKSRSFFSGGFGFAAWAISTILMFLGVINK